MVNRTEQTISHHHVRDLPELLNPNDLLILNDTKVIPAKIVGYRKLTGGRWQGLFLEMGEDGQSWRVLAKTRGKIAIGETVVLQDRNGVDKLEIAILANLGQGNWAVRPVKAITDDLEVEISDKEQLPPIDQLLSQIGRVPLPHYIRDGNMVEKDLEDYQTVFAKNVGAVAAPTAGLHLTKRILNELSEKDIDTKFVTLHVGIGTFRPIKSNNLTEHEMHRESASVSEETALALNDAKTNSRRVIAVGTTSVRTLETPEVKQAYKAGQPWKGESDLFIYPGFKFETVDAMLTNFHLPRTSLLVMIRTFGGDDLMKRAYAEAISQRYRFFSYGDAMLIV